MFEELFQMFRQSDGKLMEPGHWIEVASEGTIIHPRTGDKKTISAQMLQEWYSEYQALTAEGNAVPVVDSHSKSPADKYGVVKAARLQDVNGRKSFQVQVEWMDSVKSDARLSEALGKSSVSPWFGQFVSPDGKRRNRLMHVGVTDYPVLKGLRVFSDSYFSEGSEELSIMVNKTPTQKKGVTVDPKILAALLGVSYNENMTEQQFSAAISEKFSVDSGAAKKAVLAERKAFVESLVKTGDLEEEAMSVLEPFLDEDMFSLKAPKTDKFYAAVGVLTKKVAEADADDDDDDDDDELSEIDDSKNKRVSPSAKGNKNRPLDLVGYMQKQFAAANK